MRRKTLAKAVEVEGIGLQTGQKIVLRLCPVAQDSGLHIQRVDTGAAPLKATVENLADASSRSTNLGSGESRVHTVEHLLSALRASEVTDLKIEVDGPEIPLLDGSSQGFIKLIEEAGIVEKEQTLPIFQLKDPLYLKKGDSELVALPLEPGSKSIFEVSALIHYPQNAFVGTQFLRFALNPADYKKEIASSRTFCLYEEVEQMQKMGLMKGGSLEAAVVIKGDEVLTPGGLRYEDEMIRHKVLDLIGDLSLVGQYFSAHIIALCPGHNSNTELAKKIFEHIRSSHE